MRKLLILTIAILSFSITNGNAQISKKLFFVFLNTNPDKEKISDLEAEKLQSAHLENIGKLNKEGKLLAAGPFDGGGGMFVLHADDMTQANSYLESDPAIAAKRFIIEIFPFNIYNGRICGASEPYEMVSYQLVRLHTNKADPDALGQALLDNRLTMADLQYKTKQLIVHGKFGDDNDGVLILNVSNPKEADDILSTHPAVIDGQITYETKTLWIAKGTFCEE
ncbi:MAG: hypothetical protein HQ521_01255 [Bacteroidetes bacterium]|nr:hypothetical protein [Bacteroidota bacterium]